MYTKNIFITFLLVISFLLLSSCEKDNNQFADINEELLFEQESYDIPKTSDEFNEMPKIFETSYTTHYLLYNHWRLFLWEGPAFYPNEQYEDYQLQAEEPPLYKEY